MKLKSGILLTGGKGTRLGKFTQVSNKHLHPIGDKLVLDYSLNAIRGLGITNLTVVLGGEHFDKIVEVLKDGSEFGLHINYVYQKEAAGIAQGIQLCRPFINDEPFAVVLGDNVFQTALRLDEEAKGAQVFINDSPYIDLHHFGVVSLYSDRIMRFEEKPEILATGMDNYAITGAYIFTQKYFEYFANIKPSTRGEYEIIDIIKQYHSDGDLVLNKQPGWWSDLGTPDSIRRVMELNDKEPVEFV